MVKPAAVALPTPMALLGDAPTPVVWTPATTHDQAFWPEPASWRPRGVLADRGSGAFHSLRRVQEAGGVWLIRAKAGLPPQVVEALREDGQRWRALRHQPRKPLHAKLPQRQRVERGVRGEVDGPPWACG